MSIVGLASTLAKEGASRNILVNTIAPLAGSRMTATVMPPDLVAALKPEYVAALVAYLCHESFKESGQVFEVGAGWVARVRRERSDGWATDPKKLTPEELQKNLSKAYDWTHVSYPESPADSTGFIMSHLAKL